MSTISFKIDGREVEAQPGQTILAAAQLNGVYIPHLCAMKGLVPHGSCRVCLVLVNGRPQAACTQPATAGAVVESETPALQDARRAMIEMLYVEGNHICPMCEKSGDCELQALAYRLGVAVPRYPFMFPKREVDASHPDALVEHNRCVLCARCVRASRDIDGKHVFDFVNRGGHKRVAVNSGVGLGGTALAVSDRALEVCPVGSLMKKRVGFAKPYGTRLYDQQPIGADVEQRGAAAAQTTSAE